MAMGGQRRAARRAGLQRQYSFTSCLSKSAVPQQYRRTFVLDSAVPNVEDIKLLFE